MGETPFYRLKLSRRDMAELRNQALLAGAIEDVLGLLRSFPDHGCLPFGRLDETLVRLDGPVVATLERTCAAVGPCRRSSRNCFRAP